MTKVLVIEQDEAVSQSLTQLLSLSNFEVSIATDGPSGVAHAYQDNPMIIICSKELPVIDGFGVLQLIRQHENCAKAIFIMLSQKLEWEEVRTALDHGIDDFIFKPINYNHTMTVIQKRLQHQYSPQPIRKQTNGSPVNFLESLVSGKKEIFLKKRQQVFREGSRPSQLYYVSSGTVKSSRINDDGKEFIMNLHKTGDFFGHVAILENELQAETTETMEDTLLIEIPALEFLQYLENNPSAMRFVLNTIVHNLKEHESKLLNIAYNSLRKKVADALIELHRKCCVRNHELFIEMSRDNLAAVVGVAKESLIRTLKDFEQEALINLTHNKVKVINLKKLETMVN